MRRHSTITNHQRAFGRGSQTWGIQKPAWPKVNSQFPRKRKQSILYRERSEGSTLCCPHSMLLLSGEPWFPMCLSIALKGHLEWKIHHRYRRVCDMNTQGKKRNSSHDGKKEHVLKTPEHPSLTPSLFSPLRGNHSLGSEIISPLLLFLLWNTFAWHLNNILFVLACFWNLNKWNHFVYVFLIFISLAQY